MASRGLRTLAIAVRQNLSSDAKAVPITDLEEDLTLVAILGIKVLQRLLCLICAVLKATARPLWAMQSGNVLTGMGHLPLQDPVRATVPYTIQVCKEAGITVKMVTGA